MKLIIFDIDQTLVDLIGFHMAATTKIFKEVFKVDVKLDEVDFLGRTFHRNVSDLAKLHGVSQEDVDKNLEKLGELYDTYLVEALPENVEVLSGVKELLEKLNDKEHFLAVVTGNNHDIADLILQRSNLRDYFHVLVTGDMDDNRAELVHKAILAAEKIVGKKFDEVVIFGDSVEDVKSGKPHKAKTIAVCTGFHSKEKLEKEGPSFIFDDLSDIKKIMEAVDGN